MWGATTNSLNNQPWLEQALTGPLAWRCLLLSLVFLLVLVGCVRALLRSRPQPGSVPLRDLQCCRRGTATMEFTLVFPIALFMMMALAQTTLLMGGNIFVHYAAFAATRSAIVQIPRALPEEPSNTISNDESSEKHQIIRRAAAFALVPVAGKLDTGAAPADQFTAGLSSFYEAGGQAIPPWVRNISGPRLRYADAYTGVTVRSVVLEDDDQVRFEDLGDFQFGPKDAINVEVEHKLNLAIPYAGAIFADGRHTDGNRGLYTVVKAQYTLSNEGVSTALPTAPTIPRFP